MANSWEERIKRVVKKVIRTEYAHLEKPAAMKCKITKVTNSDYSIVILDENNNRDTNYPEIPKVKSVQTFKKGDIVAVIFLNGQDAYLVGSVSL